jgi:hypothetical protein
MALGVNRPRRSARSSVWEYYYRKLKALHLSTKRNLWPRVPKLKLMETTLGSDWSSEGVVLRETRTLAYRSARHFF